MTFEKHGASLRFANTDGDDRGEWRLVVQYSDGRVVQEYNPAFEVGSVHCWGPQVQCTSVDMPGVVEVRVPSSKELLQILVRLKQEFDEEKSYTWHNFDWIVRAYVSSISQLHRQRQNSLRVLSVDDVVCGFVVGDLHYEKVLLIETWPECQRRGVGTRLVEHVVALAQGYRVDTLTLESASTGSTSFWKRMGFAPLAQGEGFGGGVPMSRQVEAVEDME